MTCTREPVRMLGVLRSNGQAANCMVSALRATLSGTRLFKHCGYFVEWVSKPLPDGNYKLVFDGKTIDISCSKGAWRTIALRTVMVQPKPRLEPPKEETPLE